MSKSIGDQFLGLGLTNKKQLQKDKAAKLKQDKQSRKHKTAAPDETKLSVEKARLEKTERDRELNLERQALANEKALLAQAKQMIETSTVPIHDAELKFNFADRFDNKIKFIYVTDTIQNDLARGRLAIAGVDQKYYVVTKKAADKIRERSEQSILFMADAEQLSGEVDEDDPYKDFVIPDDLMW